MSRITLIRDTQGETRYHPGDYPLTIGGDGAAIRIPGAHTTLAYIGQERGHAFVQPAEGETAVWHNHEQLQGSAWLKSGDQLQIGQMLVLWQVQGDRITVSVTQAEPGPVPPLPLTHPSSPPPPASTPHIQATPAGTRRGFRWALFGTFALLILAAAFVLLSSTVTIRIEPRPTHISLQGFPPAILMGHRALALPGHYTLRAVRPGYLDLVETVEVVFGENQAPGYTLHKAPGRLNLTSTPPGAQLFVDGKAVAHTPVRNLELAAGRHRIRLEAPHFLTTEQELEILGMGQTQRLELALAPNSAPLTLNSMPADAEVVEDGRSLGRTPLTTELDAGQHRLELHKPGFKPMEIRVQVAAGEARTLPVVPLQKLDGILHLSSRPPGATVSVDDRFQGRTPLELPLSADKQHRIRLTRAGFSPYRQDMLLQGGEQRKLEVHMNPEYGTLFLSVQPADAELLIDGRSRGAATARLRLTTRVHRIEIRKKGYAPYRARITPQAGISQTIEVTLKASGEGPAPAEARSDILTTAAGQRLKRVQPAAPVTLGASRREPGRRANEQLRKVQLSRPFYIATREVTNREFRLFNTQQDSGRFGGLSLNGDTQPVVEVSWNDAARYLNWLSRKDGLPPAYEEHNGNMVLKRPVGTGYRLPSEAEWAYAARFAGRNHGAQYPWGERRFPPSRVQGNYADGSARSILPVVIEDYEDGHPVSAPVGSFDPSPIGLSDMDGNVAEWCLDYYDVYPGGGTRTVKDPLGPETGRHHVIRGSSWRDASITELRFSYRDYGDKPRDDLGFRVARYAR